MKRKYEDTSSETAYEKISDYIINNRLAPHSSLLSERIMCEKWDFSRTTIRAAVRRLEQSGRVYVVPKSGIYIAPKKLCLHLNADPNTMRELREQGHVYSTTILSHGITESAKKISTMLRIPLGTKVFELQRLRLLDGEPLTIEMSYTSLERFPEIDKIDFSQNSLYKTIEEKYGISIYKDNIKIRVATATEIEGELLCIPQGTPLFCSLGLVLDNDGNRIEYFKNLTRNDYFAYASELRRE